MVVFRVALVTDADAHALLEEYFTSRGISTLNYVIKHPDPANFVAPEGVFLVVDDDEGPVGCGGIRRLDATRYEVKHVWIRPRARGRGLGRRLLTELERRAVELGATHVVLDTNASQVEAGNLYNSAGYEPIEPYNDNPNATHWFSKAVRSATRS